MILQLMGSAYSVPVIILAVLCLLLNPMLKSKFNYLKNYLIHLILPLKRC